MLRSASTGLSNLTKKGIVLDSEKESPIEVYKGLISNYIYKVKAFSLLTSCFGFAVQPLILQRAIETQSSTALLIGTFTFIGFFTLVTPVLLHLLTRKYIISLTYCPKTDTYTASTYSFFLKTNYVSIIK